MSEEYVLYSVLSQCVLVRGCHENLCMGCDRREGGITHADRAGMQVHVYANLGIQL